MHLIRFPLYHRSLIGANSSNDVVDRGCNSLIFESFYCPLECAFLLEHLPKQPAIRNGIVLDDTDQILLKIFSLSSVHIYWEGSKPNTSQCEYTTDNSVDSEQSLAVLVIFHVDQ